MDKDTREILAGMVTADIVWYITKDFGTEEAEAMNQFYGSYVFGKLMDFETGLYRESPAYVYDLFKIEKEHGHLVQLEE
ncbi:hypothetical protein AGMMS50267_15410 [Spirochaetia bacterium]|nr:hypothetical protein AGMMS50267_15410 [Spirochaetia bacterium]